MPQEKLNWDTQAVFLDNRYHTNETWQDKDGKDLHPQQAYYVAPGFASKVSLADQGDIVQLADDASNSSNTVVKFVFLDATPAPYVRLADYAQDLLLRLDLQSGIVVVVTPQQAAAASNRLAGGAIASLVTQQLKRTGLNRPGLLAAGIGRTILQQANDNSRSSTIRSVIAAILVVLVVLAVLAFMIVRITRRAPLAHRQLQPPYASVAAHKRAR